VGCSGECLCSVFGSIVGTYFRTNLHIFRMWMFYFNLNNPKVKAVESTSNILLEILSELFSNIALMRLSRNIQAFPKKSH
jgi:hypothetical protein